MRTDLSENATNSCLELVGPPARHAGDRDQVDIVVLIACCNRRERTLAALRRLTQQRLTRLITVSAVLVDAGSTDGTTDVVLKEFPWVDIVAGDRTMYWSTSMEVAQRRALDLWDPRFALWLNDDVLLDPEALLRLVDTAESFDERRIVTGALRDHVMGVTSYTAMRRTGPRPTQLRLVDPTSSSQPADTFNGNLVLVPRFVFSTLGTVDGRYGHAYGDLDYGFRAGAAGFGIVLAAGHLGTCSRNRVTGTWRDPTLARWRRVRLLASPKGAPLAAHTRFLRRHSNRFWLVHLFASYVRAGASIIGRRRVLGWNADDCDIAAGRSPGHRAVGDE